MFGSGTHFGQSTPIGYDMIRNAPQLMGSQLAQQRDANQALENTARGMFVTYSSRNSFESLYFSIFSNDCCCCVMSTPSPTQQTRTVMCYLFLHMSTCSVVNVRFFCLTLLTVFFLRTTIIGLIII